MYGWITGVTETDDINYCPKCGSDDLDRFIDGTAKCCTCGYACGVVETEESEEKKNDNQ